MLGDALVPAAFVLAIDQASKRLVLGRLGSGSPPRVPIGLRPLLRPRLSRTIGLGLVSDRRALLMLWGFAALGALLLVHYAPPFQTWLPRVGLGAALGGATSNLLDWVRRGAVIDFIDLRVWPVFNIADVFIVLGAGVALWSIL